MAVADAFPLIRFVDRQGAGPTGGLRMSKRGAS
jgi:hypothetical protein